MSVELIAIESAIVLAHQRSVALYLQRQAIAEQFKQSQIRGQQLQAQAQQMDLELVALDGELRALESLKAGPRGE